MYVVCRFPNAKRLEIFTENESIEVVLDIRLWALGMFVLYPHFQIVKTIIGNDLDSLTLKNEFFVSFNCNSTSIQISSPRG